MLKMSELLRPTVFRVVQDYAQLVGIAKPQIVVTEGSKNGDSYSGEVYRILVRDEGGISEDEQGNVVESKEPEELLRDPHFNQLTTRLINRAPNLHFIAKIPPQIPARRQAYSSAQHFTREHYVYEHVLPAFEQFQTARNLIPEDRFDNYPRMVGASSVEEDEYVVLNDLTKCGFRNADKTTPLGFDKCVLVLTHLARFHAISFAFKDQQPERFAKLTANLSEIMFKDFVEPMDTFLRRNVGYALSTLDADRDEVVIERVKELREKITNSMVAACAERADATVLHGDCWISNLMFRKTPHAKEEIQFLDWQVARYGSVAIDLSYFVCCCTDAEVRKKLADLLRIYHSVLIERINDLGSNGASLFPTEQFNWHIKNYFKFGFGMAAITLHATCYPASKMADVKSSLDSVELNNLDELCKPMLSNPAYIERMSDLCRDLVRMEYI